MPPRKAWIKETNVRIWRLRQRLGDAISPVILEPERCAGHSQWTEYGVQNYSIEILARGHFEDSSKNIGRMTVVPRCSRLVFERQSCNPIHEVGKRQVSGQKAIRSISSLRWAITEEAIGQPGGMSHQVLNCWPALRRSGLVLTASHTQISKRWNEFGDLLVEAQQTSFNQHHRRDGN